MDIFSSYSKALQAILADFDWTDVYKLAKSLRLAWLQGRRVYICGNGGSAANALHFANDLVSGVVPSGGAGLKAHALSANTAVLTCLANDVGYENIFACELENIAQSGDVLIVFSGSGNSANILQAIRRAKQMGLHTFAVLGYSGGQAKQLVDTPIHFSVNDMQIAEDCQQVVVHMVIRWLKENPVSLPGKPQIKSKHGVDSLPQSSGDDSLMKEREI